METIPSNQTHLAAMLGLSKGTVSQQVKRGMPTDSLEAAQTWRAANIDPARKKGQRYDQHHLADQPDATRPVLHPPGTDEDFQSARRREKIAAANLAEIEEAAKRDLYLVKADFERHLFNAARQLRDTLTTCARRISAEVAGLSTPEQCEAVIDREHRAALAGFAQQFRQKLTMEIETAPPSAPNFGEPTVST